MEKTKLTDILELPYLQHLQESFASLTHLTTVILSQDGEQITKPSNYYGFCALLNANADGLALCGRTNQQLLSESRRLKKPVVLTCAHSGLQTGAVPIFLEEEFLGAWIIGQAYVNDIDVETILEGVAPLGIDRDKALSGLKMLPRTGPEEFGQIFAFLDDMTRVLVGQAENAIALTESNAQLTALSEELRVNSEAMNAFFDNSTVGMYIVDYETQEILMANDFIALFFGLDKEGIIGKKCYNLVDEDMDSPCPFCPKKKLVGADGMPLPPYTWINYLESYGRWLQCTSRVFYWMDGRLVHMVTFLDITDNKLMSDELAHLAYYDRRMEIPNAVCLERDLEPMEGARSQIICFDILSLRKINDLYGREAGDALLDAIRDWILESDIPGAQLYRMDGDEFCIRLTASDDEEAMAVAHGIYMRFNDAWNIRQGIKTHTIFCSVTLAVLLSTAEYSTFERFMSILEHTMEASRRCDNVAVYSDEIERKFREHLALEMDLRNSVRENMRGFAVYYQPIVNPTTGTWAGMEALIRWTNSAGELQSPLRFVPELEQLGLMGQVGEWVLDTAIKQAKAWGLDNNRQFLLDVNVSPLQLLEPDFDQRVLAIIRWAGYPGNKLALEITESSEVQFSQQLMDMLQKLREAGIMLALDDFGTGYSSFNNLKNLPAFLLKTDRAFVQNIENDAYLQHLFAMMLELGHAADMRIVAEGVETESQMRLLMRYGADLFQGYLFSMPLPPEEFEKHLDKFYNTAGVMPPGTQTRIDMHMVMDASSGYTLTPQMYKLLMHCMQKLYYEPDLDAALHDVLATIGAYLDISRTYIFLKEPNGHYSNTHEWCSGGIEPVRQYLQNVDLESAVPGWLENLCRDGAILATDVDTLDRGIAVYLKRQGIRSVLALPLWDGDAVRGFVGCDECISAHEWAPEEVQMLHNLCLVIGNVIANRDMQRQLVDKSRIFENVVNHMNTYIYVSNLETGEIIMANKMLTDALGIGDLEGKICWEVMQHSAKRCDFCSIPQLRESGKQQRIWEYYNAILHKPLRVYDSIIPWEGGKEAFLQYSVDTSPLRAYQEKLENYSQMDMFTMTLNRHAFLGELRERLSAKGAKGVLAYADADHLHAVNMQYGFDKGDELLRQMVEMLRAATGPDDLLGRYAGDVFLLYFASPDIEKASALLEEAKNGLRSVNGNDFSFGLASIAEEPEDISRLVERAHDSMADMRKGRGK